METARQMKQSVEQVQQESRYDCRVDALDKLNPLPRCSHMENRRECLERLTSAIQVQSAFQTHHLALLDSLPIHIGCLRQGKCCEFC